MDNLHPSINIKGTISSVLEGKKIVLCVTGSVAAIRSGDIARLLMRHGCEVYPVMTTAAQQIIHPDYLHWATGHKTITHLTGAIEHVGMVGNVVDKADLMLLAPATANTIGKIATGIDDSAVTTFITTGIGEGIPLLVVPAMHQSMYNNPFVIENIQKLKKIGIQVLLPRIEEEKAKIPDENLILQAVITKLCTNNKLKGKKVLITTGRTVEYIDPIRVITNNSTGKMGMAMAKAAHLYGAEVTVIYGKGSVIEPDGVKILRCETAGEMQTLVDKELKNTHIDIFISTAAVGDWKPVNSKDKKISTHTHKKLMLELIPTPKILDNVKIISPKTFVCAFRAQYRLSEKELIQDGISRMDKAKADMIAINDVSQKDVGFEKETNKMILIDKNKKTTFLQLESKDLIAQKILDSILLD